MLKDYRFHPCQVLSGLKLELFKPATIAIRRSIMPAVSCSDLLTNIHPPQNTNGEKRERKNASERKERKMRDVVKGGGKCHLANAGKLRSIPIPIKKK